MTKKEIYTLLIRMAGLVLGFYWITALVWATDYLGTEYLGKLVFQYLFQGLIIYLMLFQSDLLLALIFKSDEESTGTSSITTKEIVSAGIILLGLYSIYHSIDDIVLYFLSDHQAFAVDLGDSTFISLKQFVLAWINLVLGLILIFLRTDLSRWLTRSPETA